jgi:hypothetical protein
MLPAPGNPLTTPTGRILSFRIIAARSCLAVGLLACAWLVASRGTGAWYFQTKSPEGLQAAIRWDPGNAQYYDALATMRHFYADNEDPNEQVKLYERATSLSPKNAQFWADLGVAYDWAGDQKDALRALERARELFPNSPEINWRLANFYFRTGNTPEGLAALRKVLRGGGVARQHVFALAESATRDKKAILDQMVPPEEPILLEYLNFQANAGDITGAEQVWSRLLALKLPFDAREAFFYLDALIQKRDTQRLATAWASLSERFPEKIGSLIVLPNLVANGGFESDILNGGLDWRVVPTEGASVNVDLQEPFEGKRSLRIQYDGTRNLDYGHLFQYVLVRPGTRYRFSGYMRTNAITTDSGPRFQVFDAYDATKEFVATENTVGSTGWTERRLEFKTPADTSLLIIRIARAPSSKFDNQVGGTVWIDRVQLIAEE